MGYPKKTREQVIDNFNKVHNYKYDYSLMEHINMKTNIKIICKEHGVFLQRPDHHLRGSICKKCNNKLHSDRTVSTSEIFIESSKIKHNDYYIYEFTNYINAKTPVIITCPIHGNFEQVANSHSMGCGCKKCGDIKMWFDRRNDENDIIRKAEEVHGERYDYSLVNYINAKTPISIICKKHGIFKQTTNHHISKGSGCPKCNESRGERTITEFLNDNNILLKKQKTFKDCMYKRPLKFDFYLPDYNTCIEYDGEQHYIMSDFFGGEKVFKQNQIRDKIKTDYCKDNGIRLIRISYKDFKNIDDILEQELIKKTD